MENFQIREIRIGDNEAMARIIRSVLVDFDAHQGGTAYDDDETNHMYEAFQDEDARYFVVEMDGILLGGAGVKRLKGQEEGYCELQKMYLLPQARGKGVGNALLELCLDFAKNVGYKYCYLETLTTMEKARELYQKFGFVEKDKPVGKTGHYGCNVWMEKRLSGK